MVKQTLEQAIKEAYEKGWVDNPEELPDCYAKQDPKTNTRYNCEECPLETHCCEAWDEVQSGVMMP